MFVNKCYLVGHDLSKSNSQLRYRDSNLRRQKNRRFLSSCDLGESGAFCLKICDILAQQDKFSTDITITFGHL